MGSLTGPTEGGADVAPIGSAVDDRVVDCAQVHERAAHDPLDARFGALACDGMHLSPARAHAIVRTLTDRQDAAEWVARLEGTEEAQAVARLLAWTLPPADDEPIPDADEALVLPIDDAVLARVARASAARMTEAGADTRTRADAYLAKVHAQARQSMEAGERGSSFVAMRLLSGRAAYFAVAFCRAYVQRRVLGLHRAFASAEIDLLSRLVDLDAGPHAADPPILVVGSERGRDWVRGDSARVRIERQIATEDGDRAPRVHALAAIELEIGRLLDLGYVDMAIDRALRAAQSPGGPGLGKVSALLLAWADEEGDASVRRRVLRAAEAAKRAGVAELGPGVVEGGGELAPSEVDEAVATIERWLNVYESAAAGSLGQLRAEHHARWWLRARPDAAAVILLRAAAQAPLDATVRVGAQGQLHSWAAEVIAAGSSRDHRWLVAVSWLDRGSDEDRRRRTWAQARARAGRRDARRPPAGETEPMLTFLDDAP